MYCVPLHQKWTRHGLAFPELTTIWRILVRIEDDLCPDLDLMFLLVILYIKRVTRILKIHIYSLHALVPSYETQDQLLGLVSLCFLCFFQIIALSFLCGKKKKPCIFEVDTQNHCILFITVLSHPHSLTHLSTIGHPRKFSGNFSVRMKNPRKLWPLSSVSS